MRQTHTLFEHLGKWIKNHPISNVIDDRSQFVLLRKQLHTDSSGYFDAFLTVVEPKNIKKATTEPSLINAMQEEIHEFERLQVWELVSFCLCARYQAKPTEKHLQAVKRIFRYLKGTINMGLWYSKDTDMSLIAYADADHAGYSSLRSTTKVFITLCCNNVQHSRAKHIDVHYHFIKAQVENGIAELYFVWTEYQLADIFTKPLPRERFNFLIEKLGMRSMSLKTLKRLAEETNE
ncbi:hypothetical protein Tco_1283485 [Tanacetum coccineum]